MPDEKEAPKLTKAQEARKSTKPIMEKRRRARINASLCELKALLLDVIKKEGARTNKMEKADILEMTVKHLRNLQRQQFEVAMTADPTVYNKYQNGFSECASEVSRYLGAVEGIDVELQSRLLNHLANCVQNLDNAPVHSTRASPPATAHVRPMPIQPPPVSMNNSVSPTSHAQSHVNLKQTMSMPEINNNVIPNIHELAGASIGSQFPLTSQQNSGKSAHAAAAIPMQAIGERVKSAPDLAAFVIPSNLLAGGQMPGYIIPLYAGNAASSSAAATGLNSQPINTQAPFGLPTVVPQQLPIVNALPVNLQQKQPPTPPAPQPRSPQLSLQNDQEHSKGMDLTIDSKYREEASLIDLRVDVQGRKAHSVEYEDIKVPIPIPAHRSGLPIAQARNDPMWRPW